MKQYLGRVVAEKNELLEKLLRLKQFILKADFQDLSASERFLLIRQSEVMEQYAIVLDKRINNGIREPQEHMIWQPIETVPHLEVLLLNEDGEVMSGKVDSEREFFVRRDSTSLYEPKATVRLSMDGITHWMPMPRLKNDQHIQKPLVRARQKRRSNTVRKS